MGLPDHLSVSQMNKFMNCPLAYRFKYIDRIKTSVKSSNFALGTAFHSAAEQLHKDMIAGQAKDPDVYRQVFSESLAMEFGCFDITLKKDESQESLTKQGCELTDLYFSYRTVQKDGLTSAEQKIRRSLVDVNTGEELEVPFVAYLDLLEKNAAGHVVVDLKTSCKSYSQRDVDQNMQLTAYALLVFHETGKIPTCRIDAVVRNKKPKLQRIETQRTRDDLQRFFVLAKTVRRSICAAADTGVFYPSAGMGCFGCEFTYHCNKWGLAA